MKKEIKEELDYKHKLIMEELAYTRKTEENKQKGIMELEEQKHQLKLEELRISFAESKKLQEAKARIRF